MDPVGPSAPSLSSAALNDDVRAVLSPVFLREALSYGLRGYRERTLTIEVMATCLLHLVIARLGSLREIVLQLRLGQIPGLPPTLVSPSALYKRLAKIPHTAFATMLEHASAALGPAPGQGGQRLASLAPFAHGIYALDDTTLDALARKLDSLKLHGKGDYGALGGRLGCLYDLIERRFVAFAHDTDSSSNERHRLEPLIERLSAGALVVLDLGYFAFDLFDVLSTHHVYFVTRMKSKVVTTEIQVLAEGEYYRDSIVHLGGAKSRDHAAHPVRLVELHIDGEWWRYITNVCDPRMLPADRVWALYRHRWSIEIAFAAVKRSLGLATLHACHSNGVLSQVWATLTVYHVIGRLREDVAVAAGWDTDDVSWELLMRRITLYVGGVQSTTSPSLRDWLVKNAKELWVKKSGRRLRRPTALPDEVLFCLRRTRVTAPASESLEAQRPKRRPSRLRSRPTKRTMLALSTASAPRSFT